MPLKCEQCGAPFRAADRNRAIAQHLYGLTLSRERTANVVRSLGNVSSRDSVTELTELVLDAGRDGSASANGVDSPGPFRCDAPNIY